MSSMSRRASSGRPQPCAAQAGNKARISPVAASLADFVSAGLRPRTPLQKTVVAALAIKLAMIVSMQLFLAIDSARVPADDQRVARLIGAAAH